MFAVLPRESSPGEDAAGLAQLVEQLPCKHQVVGSSPSAGTILVSRTAPQLARAFRNEYPARMHSVRAPHDHW